MNDQEFDNVTRSLRKSWSRQGTRNLRAYVLELQGARNELGDAVTLLAEVLKLGDGKVNALLHYRIKSMLMGVEAKIRAHVAAGIGADPQPQIKAKPQQYRDHSNHVVLRQEDWQPCYCWSEADHRIGQEVHQPVVTGFSTGSQVRIDAIVDVFYALLPSGEYYPQTFSTREKAETWARENGYGIVRE